MGPVCHDGVMSTENVKLAVGEQAPAFNLPAAGGGTISIDDLRGNPAVIWFYPQAMTSLCTRQAEDLRDNYADLTVTGARIVGISPDPVAKLNEFIEKKNLPFDLLSDENHAVGRAYGAFGTKNMYGRTVEGVIRSTFVLDENGILTAVKYRVGTPKHIDFVQQALGLG